ncbi:hypothetical protein GH5_05398 [Leishmania sp. Ghana 2012 LV757]|uniref:hypothetical protein n=1 Tax=Leishmania sp. Ghana 2012 LV757 TaxID=2803181 RepID=UPI001B668D1A|nr:hypothetical protein GH5_05398 [Leishmania sp. Ghana 2012 LV757]
MSWTGFSARGFGGGGRGASTGFPYRGGASVRDSGQFSAGYTYGGNALTDYCGDGGGSGSLGFGVGGLLHQARSGTDGGPETPRVAVIGTGPSVFQHWWAIHAGGLRISVVVGTGDAKVSHSSNSSKGTAVAAAVSDAERKASAETAYSVALRCVEFYRLPQSNGGTAAGGETPLVDVRVCMCDSAAESASEGGAGVESRKASTTGAAGASSIPASVSASSASAKEKEKDCVIATAWSWFLKPLLRTQSGGTVNSRDEYGRAPFSSSSGVTDPGFWSARSGAVALSLNAAATSSSANSLVDEVEVVYLVDYGADCDETGVRVALLWLLEHGKQIVVECALSAETLAICAAAAAAMTSGKPEMKRLFLYRGGGCRRGWSDAAMTQLRKSLGVRRATCRTVAKAFSASSPSNAVLGGRSVFTAVSTKTSAPVVSSDGGFSVFDFMGSSLGGALKDAEGASRGGMEKERPSISEKDFAVALATANLPTSKGDAKQALKSPAPTSIAVNAAASIVGAVRHISMVVIGRGNSSSADSVAAASLGIMDSLGWDAVAVVLHLLDWTCPDMVVGRVLRRASGTHQPLCVQAEMYYGIEGTAKESSEGQESLSGSFEAARPSYLCVSLHVAASASGALDRTDEEKGDLDVFQQSLRIVGTKAVLSVSDPLLPSASSPTASSPSCASSTATTTVTSATGTVPVAPKVSHRYRLATQDVSPVSGQCERREEEVTVGSAEPCAECRVWQGVRSQLNVTAASLSPRSGAGLSNYQVYASRSASRGGGLRRGARGGYYDRGPGTRGRRTDFGGGLNSAFAASSGSTVAADVVNPESAASDVRRAWLVQIVVESILASAAKLPP